MMKQFLEAGEIVNTHGINGEVKINPWCDSAEFLASMKCLYIDEKPVKVAKARVHKNCVLVKFAGIDSIEQAMELKRKIVFINRSDVKLPKGTVFVQDLIGLDVYDLRFNKIIGKLTDVMNLPTSDVYVVKSSVSGNEILVPAIPEFVKNSDISKGIITICSIEGMCDDFEN